MKKNRFMKVFICVGTFFSIDKINLCFFFAGSVIFLFANNVCEAFILIALSVTQLRVE